jgi:hypothetical protein
LRGRHEAVDEQRAAFLVDLVLDRVGVHRNLDDDIELVRRLRAGGHVVQAHSVVSMSGKPAFYLPTPAENTHARVVALTSAIP